mmetsp:Transcript_54635/g.130378  ORF Transcript_54635/g.130378 Transcript_54635/m.130378 type:complete len:128 (+) Transcript_54635:111-494(+)|eukprot:CAMPEP_0178448886 /NCGR_PEP_ID=MMETSP0689_2-20121128/42237_1 /TAXON_ID=160604 /ORGANISM="Amphidinium massartii, Strain CS-259" /LENGTH=127 /DNA_ID=CAMNT_0020074129 /DNA_START=104 /DNA_END=487 /DNA_ORIENTATION=-
MHSRGSWSVAVAALSGALLVSGLSLEPTSSRQHGVFQPSSPQTLSSLQSNTALDHRGQKGAPAAASDAPLVTNNLKLNVGKNFQVDPLYQEKAAELWEWSSNILQTPVSDQDAFEMGVSPPARGPGS